MFAQYDVAAVVYAVKDNPDRLLLDCTEHLRCSGVRTAGLVQLDRWAVSPTTAWYAPSCFRVPKSFLRLMSETELRQDAGSTESWEALRKWSRPRPKKELILA